MSFGNFLLGVAEGLDRGVEAGDRISAAMDKKAARTAVKKRGEQQLRNQVATAGAEKIGAPTSNVTPPTATPPLAAPGVAPPRSMAGGGYPPSLQPSYNPAALHGAQAVPPQNIMFPGGVPAASLGAMAPRNPYLMGAEPIY